MMIKTLPKLNEGKNILCVLYRDDVLFVILHINMISN